MLCLLFCKTIGVIGLAIMVLRQMWQLLMQRLHIPLHQWQQLGNGIFY